MSLADVWSYSVNVQEKFKISKPDVAKDCAAFYAYNGEQRVTVEIQCIGFRMFIVFVDGNEHPVGTDAKHIRNVLLSEVQRAFAKKKN